MSTSSQRPTELSLRAAMEARDLAAALETFAPDAVVRSPFTDGLTFNGREQIGAILGVVLDALEDLRYVDEIHAGDRTVLLATARVDGTAIELVDHMVLDERGRIRELTVFFRPLPAIAVAMRLIGTGLARRRSGVRARLIALLARPIGLITAVGDRIGVRLVQRAL